MACCGTDFRPSPAPRVYDATDFFVPPTTRAFSTARCDTLWRTATPRALAMTNLLNAQCFVSLWSSILEENSQARSGYERMFFFARGSVVKSAHECCAREAHASVCELAIRDASQVPCCAPVTCGAEPRTCGRWWCGAGDLRASGRHSCGPGCEGLLWCAAHARHTAGRRSRTACEGLTARVGWRARHCWFRDCP